MNGLPHKIMSTPILRGAEAYAWAWLRHGPLLPYVRAQTLDLYAAQLYPRGQHGWVEGRLTVRAAAWWAQHASPEDLAKAEADAIDQSPPQTMPSMCPACDGKPLKDPANPCQPCFGDGLLHVFQPPPLYRPLP